MDEPVQTSYPHDRLTRLADQMTEDLPEDVRAVVLLNDAKDGVVHSRHYPGEVQDAATLMIIDMTEHLVSTARSVGIEMEVSVDGVPVPWERDH